MNTLNFLAFGSIVAWFLVAGYLVFLFYRLKSTHQELKKLEEKLAAR